MSFVGDLEERKVALEARLEAMRAKAAMERQEMLNRHEAEQGELIRTLDALDKLIMFESKSSGQSITVDFSGTKTARQPLPEYCLRQIKLMKKATKEDLRSSAQRQGFFPDGDNGGRSIHASLLNLQRGGKIREIGKNSGIYELMPMTNLALVFQAQLENEEGSPPINDDEPSFE